MRPLIHALLLSLIAAAAHAGAGVGDLLVTPTRIVLDHQTRTAEFMLLNTGNTAATYRVDVKHVRMTADGGFVESEEPESAFADAFVQFSPRRVVLEPHGTQTIRLRFRPPTTPVVSELYLHLHFHGEPSVERSVAPPDANSMSAGITSIYGVAVPVIVRFEETRSDVRIDGVRLATANSIAFQLARDGNRSTYGNISVTFTARGGEAREVAVVRGVSMYLPLPQRSMTLPLNLPHGITLSDGTLQVSYVDAERNGSQRATATLAVP